MPQPASPQVTAFTGWSKSTTTVELAVATAPGGYVPTPGETRGLARGGSVRLARMSGPVRSVLKPRRLLLGCVGGLLVGAILSVTLASHGRSLVPLLLVVMGLLVVAWVLSLVYVTRTERGRQAWAQRSRSS